MGFVRSPVAWPPSSAPSRRRCWPISLPVATALAVIATSRRSGRGGRRPVRPAHLWPHPRRLNCFAAVCSVARADPPRRPPRSAAGRCRPDQRIISRRRRHRFYASIQGYTVTSALLTFERRAPSGRRFGGRAPSSVPRRRPSPPPRRQTLCAGPRGLPRARRRCRARPSYRLSVLGTELRQVPSSIGHDSVR